MTGHDTTADAARSVLVSPDRDDDIGFVQDGEDDAKALIRLLKEERLPIRELAHLLATWWPLILIAIGVSMLLRTRKGE